MVKNITGITTGCLSIPILVYGSIGQAYLRIHPLHSLDTEHRRYQRSTAKHETLGMSLGRSPLQVGSHQDSNAFTDDSSVIPNEEFLGVWGNAVSRSKAMSRNIRQ